MMLRFSALLASLLSLGWLVEAAPTAPTWQFVQNGTTGIIALELMVVSPTLAIMFDIANDDPLQINGHPAWGALWDFQTNTARPLDLLTDTFCASGSILSNGSMVSVGGMSAANTDIDPDYDGRMSLRIFEPCSTPDGEGCTIFDNPTFVHMSTTRWYPSSLRIFDGSLMIVGGIHEATPFFNNDSVSSFEFFPAKDGGVARPSPFLARTVPANLFPRAIALPDGKIFMVANNQTIIYDIETYTETRLPDIPNGVRVTNPYDGTITLLPLSPPDFIPEVLVCGGTNTTDQVDDSFTLSTQDPASDQCSRILLTPEGIRRGWQVERMFEGRMMPEMILMPNGQVLIINGAGSGYAAIGSVGDLVGNSNADHPVFTPELYTPSARAGSRFSREGLPTTDIARLYHSSVTLTPMGNIFLAGSNPNFLITNDTIFNSELRAQYLNPPFLSVARPSLSKAPAKIGFNQRLTININVPRNLAAHDVQVALIDLGYSSHAFHSSSRLVFMEAQLSPDRRTLSILTPPNNRIFPPGPAYIFVTIDDVTSEGAHVMVGSGGSPPLHDSGLQLPKLDLSSI